MITGRDETRGASIVEQIRAGGHDAHFIAADFSEMSEVGRVADAAGEIDVLVNMAGFAALGSTADTDEAAFDGLFQINVKAPFFLVAALAPKIAARGGGSIINVSTMVARYGQLARARLEPDISHQRLMAMGYQGSERMTLQRLDGHFLKKPPLPTVFPSALAPPALGLGDPLRRSRRHCRRCLRSRARSRS